MAKKYYVVWSGLKTGVFETWDETLGYVNKVAGARYKSFPTRELAERAFADGTPKRATAKAKASGDKAAPRRRQSTAGSSALPASDVVIYSDGGCDPNPGRAGSGLAVYRDGKLSELWYGLFNPNGTNNTAELNALHQALLIGQAELAAGKSVTILSDSMYSINCITQWAASWERRGWKKKDGEIKNLELIKTIYALYGQVKGKLDLRHIKAHAGTEGNELADRMTMVAVDREATEFCRYPKPFDVPGLLKLRSG